MARRTQRDEPVTAQAGARPSPSGRRSRAASPTPTPPRGLRRVVVPAALAVATLVVLGVGVFPTRTYLDKRAEVAAAERELDQLRADNDDAAARAEALDADAEIERFARTELGLARPGEEIYVVLPPPAEPVRVPQGWPFDKIQPRFDAGR